MPLNPMGFLLASVLAEREGVSDPQARSRLALVGGLAGSPVTGLVLATVLARAEGASRPTTATPTSKIIQIPHVERWGLSDARERLESLRLRVRTQQVYNKRIPEGTVTSQEPDGGELALEGAYVTLYVSRGPDRRASTTGDDSATSDAQAAGDNKAASAAPASAGRGSRGKATRTAAEEQAGPDAAGSGNGESPPRPA